MAFIEAFPYYPATITKIRDESSSAKTFTLSVLVPWSYRAGQRCVIRLTDGSGYRAARDYSLSSAPSSGVLEITVGHAFKGEVSEWLHERINVGDTVEISKPLGDDFAWDPQDKTSLLLLAGGIGIVPLISILREHRSRNNSGNIAVVYSSRTMADACFLPDLRVARPSEQAHVWTTREKDSRPHLGRVTADDLKPLLHPKQRIYICGPTSFVDDMEKILHSTLHVPATMILTERFG